MKTDISDLCNVKCPERSSCKVTQTTFKVFNGSQISIPRGTKLTIYVNENPDDPESDVDPYEVIVEDDCVSAKICQDHFWSIATG